MSVATEPPSPQPTKGGPSDHPPVTPTEHAAPASRAPDHQSSESADDAVASPDPGDRTIVGPGGPRVADRTVMAGDQPPAPAVAAPPRIVEPGTLINNNYRIEQLISVGGMGEVYRAVNAFTGDPVAVKCILPDLASDSAMIDMFRSEARVLVQLRDEAIVRYHNFVLDTGLGRYCLIMEFVEGPHLGEGLRAGNALPEDEALALMRRLALGLAQVHARGVVHRDLSPDNVILRHGQVSEAVMIDFGIARWAEAGDGLAGRFAGKLKYVAPEQLGHADGQIGPRTDIYGLALLMAAMIRGRPLDMGDSIVSASAARQTIPDLTGLSHRVYPLLQFMLEPDPALRPEDMGQVVAMLSDPMRIPARYRLPLWDRTADQGLRDSSSVSDSPFGAPLALGLPEATATAPLPERAVQRGTFGVLAGGAALIAIAALAGAWIALRPTPSQPPDVNAVEVAEVATAAELPARDPATREGFLADQSLPPCTLLGRIATGPQTGMIEVLSPSPVSVSPVLDGYQAAFGTRPEVVSRVVSPQQCSTIDLLGTLAGRGGNPPAIAATAAPEADGLAIRGTVAGIDGRTPWLFLTAPDGSIYDLTGQATPGDGRLDIGLSIAGAPPGPYLLVALASPMPLTTVAAAPARANGRELLPAVLGEIRRSGGDAVAAMAALQVPEPSEPDEPADGGEAPAP